MRGFCAQCGAPQIVLGAMPGDLPDEHLTEAAPTGAPPPPRPSPIRWTAALRLGAIVAVAAAAMFVLGSAVPALSLFALPLIFGAAALVLALYRRAAPESLMTGPIGARIGLMTGLLLLSALTFGLAAVAVVARFRLHAMGAFDAQWAAQLQVLTDRASAAGQGSAEMVTAIHRPEFRAWSTLASVALLGLLLLALTTGSGALVGSLGSGGPKRSL